MKATGNKVTLLIWPTGFPEGTKEEGAPEKPFLFVVPEYDYAEPIEQSGYRPEPELGFKLSDIYATLQTGIVERTQVRLPVRALAAKTWMWLDENGLLRRRPINAWATTLYWRARETPQPIVGTVALEVRQSMLEHWPENAFGKLEELETKELA